MKDMIQEGMRREALAQRMKVEMALKLHADANKIKGDWCEVPILAQFKQLDGEFSELLEAATVGNLKPEAVWEEAADVANFAAMIADTYERAFEAAKRGQ